MRREPQLSKHRIHSKIISNIIPNFDNWSSILSLQNTNLLVRISCDSLGSLTQKNHLNLDSLSCIMQGFHLATTKSTFKKSTIVSFKGDVFRETQYFLTLQSKMIFLKKQSRDKFFINTHNRKLSTSGLDSNIFSLF